MSDNADETLDTQAGNSQHSPDGQGVQAESVDHPARLMRIASVTKQMLEEVRTAPLDADGRQRMRDVYDRSLQELSDVLSDELAQELDEMTDPFGAEVPTTDELRVTQAQLMGWLEGLFHGIQAAFVAQQIQARGRAMSAQQETKQEGQRGLGSGQYL